MKKSKIYDLITIFILSTILLITLFLWIFLPKSNISEEENRAAAEFPNFSLRSIWSGDFFDDFSGFLSDSFPLRSSLTSLNASLKLIMGERESNGVFYANDGSLIFKGEYNSLGIAERNLDSIKSFSRSLSFPVTVAIIPRSCDVNTDKLPKTYSQKRADEIYRITDRAIPYAKELRNSLFEELSKHEQVFYRTDHHLTTKGAYLAYREIISDIGLTPYKESIFTEEIFSSSFLGTAYSRSSFRFVSPDTVTLYRYDGDGEYKIAADNKSLSLYDLSALERKDKYQVFLGGNHGYLTITQSNEANKPRLLLIKDSFANAMIPFFALHFDLDVADPRYCTAPLSEIIKDKTYDRVIFLFGADTLATTAMYHNIK